ncbi:MAG: hypothetical protein JWP14_557 [Frankiales bacterium]|nr:hypothetical protein [Frankiales bacterium]
MIAPTTPASRAFLVAKQTTARRPKRKPGLCRMTRRYERNDGLGTPP